MTLRRRQKEGSCLGKLGSPYVEVEENFECERKGLLGLLSPSPKRLLVAIYRTQLMSTSFYPPSDSRSLKKLRRDSGSGLNKELLTLQMGG